MWHEDISAKRSSVSHPGTLYFFSTSQFNLLKERNFQENQRSNVHLIRAMTGLQLNVSVL